MKKVGISLLMMCLGFFSCDQLGLDLELPLQQSYSEEIEFTENGEFLFSGGDKVFPDKDLDNILGNVKSLSLDSITFSVSNIEADTLNDSLPAIQSFLAFTVDTLIVNSEVSGSLKGLESSSPNTLEGVNQDLLNSIANILTDKANNNENPDWSYNLSGTIEGAPAKATITINIHGNVTGFPSDDN